MAELGDRIEVASKGVRRCGVVTALSGSMVTVRWDTGGETSLIPGPGVLSVVTARRRTRPTISGTKVVASKSSAARSKSADKKAPARKRAPNKKRAVKTASAQMPVAKKNPSSRTTGKEKR